MTNDEFLYALHCWLQEEVHVSKVQMQHVRANTRLTPMAVGLGDGQTFYYWTHHIHCRTLARLILGPDAKNYSVCMLARRILGWQELAKREGK